jgi:DNA-binding NarL/FixJ family response regulator
VVVSGPSPVAAEFLSTNGSPPAPTLIVARAAEPCEVLEAGAAGFVPEDAALTTILEAIEQVAQGGRFMADPPAEDGRAPADTLSPRERQVLTWIAQGRTHYQVARILRISAHTVDTYVNGRRASSGSATRRI